ncbi:MAG: putative 4-hydroxybenzoate polyprenyltransferase [Planctomycetota bacterium]|nr:putative 4-hydroxybenzoate polyprenyltransferase [Planctomycetota bacterium]
MLAAVAPWFRLVRFSHSVFALPFALASAWLASGGVPEARVLLLLVVCAVAARTAAMAFNRLVDRRLDAENPRTRGRELPSGELRPLPVLLLVIVSSAAFVAGAFALNPFCGRLSLPVLAVLLGYSFVKRRSWVAHGVLGLCLALAPLGAWAAVTGNLSGDLAPPLFLAGAVLLWVAGFDLIYACQDAEHDQSVGLHSIPARFGTAAALRTSSVLHVAAGLLLVAFGTAAGLGLPYWIVVVVAAALLVWQHAIVSPDDLSRVDVAFFTLNGWVGLALFLGLALDLHLRAG